MYLLYSTCTYTLSFVVYSVIRILELTPYMYSYFMIHISRILALRIAGQARRRHVLQRCSGVCRGQPRPLLGTPSRRRDWSHPSAVRRSPGGRWLASRPSPRCGTSQPNSCTHESFCECIRNQFGYYEWISVQDERATILVSFIWMRWTL